jgi:serine/threonine-protein kinase
VSVEDAKLPEEGDVLADKYVVERVLGAGGMGVVVAARHQTLGQKVALKFLLPKALESSGARDRFLREARAAAGIKSEHVARVLDVGTLETGAPFIVMEHLDGCDLRELLERDGPLAPELAVDYVLQASEALAEAHSLGIVHRDLKPANLFLARRAEGSPFVKVLDFGISKALTAESVSGDAALTRTDAVLGSPAYMAPEQIRSAKSVDTRTDIWALGVILYELLADAPPFDADNLATLSAQICIDPPVPIQKRRSGIPSDLASVIDRCLAKEPSDRYRDLGELARALEPFAPDHAKVLIGRIGRLTRSIAFDATEPALAMRPNQPSAPGVAAGETANATATTLTEEPVRRRAGLGGLPLAALAVVGAIVVAGLSTLVLRGSPSEPAAPAASEAPPVASPPAPAPVVVPEPTSVASADTPAPSATPSAKPVPARQRAGSPAAKSPAKSCTAGQVLSNGHCCPLGLVWQGKRCDRPLATKF